MDKHAYLIIAHKTDEIFHTLLEMIDDLRNDIFIHMDLKNTGYDESYCNFIKYSNVYHTKRTNVTWGGYSQINAELLLLEMSLQTNEYAYFHLLSGQDLPIKTQDYIHNYLKGKDTIYVGFNNDDNSKRCQYRYFFQEKIGRSNGLLKQAQRFILYFQKIFKITRNKNLIVKSGCNWFTIPNDFAIYILNNKNIIKKEYKNGICCDELFIQTLLYSSNYKCRTYSFDNDDCSSSLRLIDWDRGSPYVFRKMDFDLIVKSQMLFARKFDPNIDSQIIKMIKGYINK